MREEEMIFIRTGSQITQLWYIAVPANQPSSSGQCRFMPLLSPLIYEDLVDQPEQ